MSKQRKNIQQRTEDGSREGKNLGVLVLLQKVPPTPKGLNADGKKLWKETCEQMIVMRTLTRASLVAVEQFVMLQMLARQSAKPNSKGTLTQKLAVLREARLAGEDLGLSPSAHAKVRRPEGAVLEDPREMAAAELIDR